MPSVVVEPESSPPPRNTVARTATTSTTTTAAITHAVLPRIELLSVESHGVRVLPAAVEGPEDRERDLLTSDRELEQAPGVRVGDLRPARLDAPALWAE